MGYWINFDNRDTLHREDCEHVKRWAQEQKWKRFDTESAARQSTSESRLHECQDCLGAGTSEA